MLPSCPILILSSEMTLFLTKPPILISYVYSISPVILIRLFIVLYFNVYGCVPLLLDINFKTALFALYETKSPSGDVHNFLLSVNESIWLASAFQFVVVPTKFMLLFGSVDTEFNVHVTLADKFLWPFKI